MTAADAVEYAPRLEYMLTLDAVAFYAKYTLFNPLVWVGIWLGHGLASDEWLTYPAYGAAILYTIAALRYANRVYSCAGSRFFLPRRVSAKGRVSWVDQIVLITGGGSGIGALLAEVLADRGATVVILTKDPAIVPIEKRHVHYYICDVSEWKAVRDVAGIVQKEVGDPTMIINNAGIVKGKLLLDLTEDDVRDTFGANTIAHYWTLKAFLPAMLKKGSGHVVSVASILGVVGTAQMSDYCASKAAVISLHQSLRQELDNRYKTPQIRTTLVLPSHITTSLFSSINMPSRGIWSFVAPPLTPAMVVRAIVEALDADTSTIIRLPFYAQLLRVWGPAVGILPKPLVDLVQWLVGADTAMKKYGPKPDAAERLHAELREQREQR